jgi:hypothetical protein
MKAMSEKICNQMRTPNVKIGEICRVGLVKIIIDFEERSGSRGDDRLEERFGA